MIKMALHTKELNLVLSNDAKPRLKWTPELHRIFIDAIKQLGGAEKATPKALMKAMGVNGLTLYHLKSHLQKYRLGKAQQTRTFHQNNEQGNGENQRDHFTSKISNGSPEHINESSQIAHNLQMQMEVQRKLHEQIEVQRHLQLRIEAQGKYLQSVLEKAQETISGYSSCLTEVEQAKAQLSWLMSMVDSGCPSSSFSALTESNGSMLRDSKRKQLGKNVCSLESSLTSSENSERNEDTPSVKNYPLDNDNKGKRNSVVLSLMEMHSGEQSRSITESHSEKSEIEKAGRRFALLENIDLNRESLNDTHSDPEVIDLNCKGTEHFNGSF